MVMLAGTALHAGSKPAPPKEEKAELLKVEAASLPATSTPVDIGPTRPVAMVSPVATSSISSVLNGQLPQLPQPALSKLRLDLRELWALQRAAKQAGGTLTIAIQTGGGITVDDLIVPLAQLKDVVIKKEGDTYVVSSAEDSAENPLQDEINRLTARRNALLQQIKFLEKSR